MKIKTIGDLAHIDLSVLYQRFGENGKHLHDLANGIDERNVSGEENIKSVSHENTFETDTDKKDLLYETICDLSERVSRRLRKHDLKGKNITLKIRLAGFKTFTRAATLPQRTNFTDVINKKSKELFDEFYKKGMKVRLLGVRVSHFEDAYIQESLFENPVSARLEKIHKAVDTIKNKFGENAIKRGSVKYLD